MVRGRKSLIVYRTAPLMALKNCNLNIFYTKVF